MFSSEEVKRFGGLEMEAARAKALRPIINSIDVTKDMLRMAVLYTEVDASPSNRVQRHFIRHDLYRWNSLSEDAQYAAASRVWCGINLSERLEYEGIDVSLDEIENLTLNLNICSAPRDGGEKVHLLFFDIDDALSILEQLRHKHLT